MSYEKQPKQLPVIGIDVDGVLANFERPFIRLMEQLTGRLPLDAPFTHAKVWDFAIHQCGYTKEEVHQAWEWLNENPSWWAHSLLPYDEQAERDRKVLQYFDACADFYYITNRSTRNARWATEKWLKGGRYGIQNPSVIISDHKGMVGAGIGMQAIIDDKPENLQDCLRTMGTRVRPYLMKRPYNQAWWEFKYFTPVTSVTEMLERELPEDLVGQWRKYVEEAWYVA